ncbi:MAG: uroporphyrinogen-III synthase [Ignavibacteriae bacterium]|nr:uroporphyrinogen-III synthase [Ignavibacteria bacterium]MBI3363949.1 uroporphyrinogen-III synthase [Ignavibacteriota bacterium]
MSLQGKTVLITRAADQADSFAHLVEERGGIPIVFPTIEIVPAESWENADRAIDGLYMYDGLIFTSINGVRHFFLRLSGREVPLDGLKQKKMFVVGEKTREAVENHGLTVTTMPEKFTAADLAKTIEHEDLHDRAFLFPCGSLTPDTLADNLKLLGASVDPIIVYQTKKPSREDIFRIRTMLFNDEINAVTFTSPSTFKNFAALFSKIDLRKLQDHTRIAVIGPVTAHAVNESGLEVDITAEKSTIESLVDAIAGAFKSEIENSKSKIT